MTQALREKTSARRVLIILAGLLVMVLALQGLASVKPGGFEAFAQATSTGPAIKIINPDENTSAIISNKNDGTDAAYHLAAWVASVPSNAQVEFKWDPDADGAQEVSIACTETGNFARFVSPDTFECHWNLAGVEADTGTVRAILYSGTTAVSTDEEPGEVDTSGETVEILYPAMGGVMGFYTRQGGATSGMIDYRSSADSDPADPDPDEDNGTTDVVAYYSTARPGQEPAWIQCGAEETTPGSQDSVRCDLTDDDGDTTANEDDSASEVTAVAVVPNDTTPGQVPDAPAGTPPPLGPTVLVGAADAHRTFGYEQDPTTVTLDPQTQQKNPGQCSDVIKATVLDQATSPRRIVGANVDVHATGPTDSLAFDDSGDNSSEHKAPEGHPEEAARDCEDTEPPVATGGTQGDHEVIGPGDIKHIESADDSDDAFGGTDENGQFKFQLFSPDAGATQIRAWADEDFNDQYCSAEASGVASIGWGSAAPSPVGTSAEQTSCPRPGSTTSPTATPTSTATASPTGTATSTGPTTSRTITLASDKNKIPAGRQFTLSGNLLSSDSSCADSNEFIQIQRRIHGTTQYENLFATAPNDQGRFSVTTRGRKSADYIAVAPAHDNCQQATSGEVTVLVKVIVQILPSDKTPAKGDRIRIKSSVRPQHDGTKLLLQRKKGRRWVTIDRTTLNKRSIGNFTVRASFNSRTFRTKWKSQHADHETGTSKAVRIRTH